MECLELLDIKGVDMDLGQSEGDAITTGQKVLLPTSWGVPHACLCPRHKGRAAQPGLGTPWRLCGLTSPDLMEQLLKSSFSSLMFFQPVFS